MIKNKIYQSSWQTWRCFSNKPKHVRHLSSQICFQKQNIRESELQVPIFDSDKYEKEILSPVKHVEHTSFNILMTKYVLALNHWLKLDENKVNHISNLLKVLGSSLIAIDDISDDSKRRNGMPAAHVTYGSGMTANSAGYAIAITVDNALQLGHPLAISALSRCLMQYFRGQFLEMHWRDNLQCPSEEEYKNMLKLKTGCAPHLASSLMQIFSDNKTDFTFFSWNFGLYIQILDDYWGLCSEKYAEKRTFCEDLTEGKFTLPIIHAIKNNKDSPVYHILKQHTRDEELKRFCIAELERCGSMQYTRDTLAALEAQIRTEIQRFNGNPRLEELMDELLTWG